MNVLPSSPEAHPDRIPVGEAFASRLQGLGDGALRLMLQALQARLGTPEEQPGDLDHVRQLGHEINNRLTAANLERDLRRLDDPSAPFPA